MVLYSWPPLSVSIAPSPIRYNLNGAETVVSRDTVTPANSRPLPVVNLDSSGQLVSPLTDAQLRATAVPVADSVLRATVGTDGATAPASSLVIAGVTAGGVQQTIEVNASGHVNITDGGGSITVDAVSLPLPTGAATEAKQDASNVLLGAVTETAPATDTASSGLNGRLQRVAQRLTSLIGLLPASIGTKTAAASLAVVLASDQTLPLPTGAATSANQTTEQGLTGALTETAPATDTASSGLNGRLQRIAQRLTSLIALLPASLGQKTMANSLAVTLASDQTALKVSSGTGAAQSDGGTIANATQGASAATLTAPANAIGFILSADDGNTDNFYFAIGATASLTSGQEMQPGRDSGFVPCGANVSIFGAASNPRYNMQWLTRS